MVDYQFSIDVALPQALTYMMATPNGEKPIFGFVTNGKHFQFIKVKHISSEYALSDEFTIANQDNGLYQVLQILKRLKELVEQ